jgi:hypothetical protein
MSGRGRGSRGRGSSRGRGRGRGSGRGDRGFFNLDARPATTLNILSKSFSFTHKQVVKELVSNNKQNHHMLRKCNNQNKVFLDPVPFIVFV